MRLVLVVVLLSSCALVKRDLPDGLYAVAATGVRVESDDGPPLTLRESPSVPLLLEGEPTTAPDGRGRSLLSVTLTPPAAAALASFTREHLGGRVAIVLGGRIVSAHQIRSVITGGAMQISRCFDDRCQILRSRLLAR
jgi:preprotein translocase subunit SecD